MRLGIFARTFSRPRLEDALQCVVGYGFNSAHFNLACAGLKSLPSTLKAADACAIRDVFSRHGVEMLGISGTFNAIHPDAALRREHTRRCCQLISLAPQMGTRLVTL